MRELLHSQTLSVPFSVTSAPDSTPTANVYAGTTLLGAATVTSAGGTRDYLATYTLPSSGIAEYTVITVRVDCDVDSEPLATSHLLIGEVVSGRTNSAVANVGSGEADWSETERSQIRHRLGIDGTKEAPAASSPQMTVTVASTSVISVDAPNADDAGRFTITQRDDYENDTDIAPIGPIRISTAQGLLRETNPPTLRFGATQMLGRKYGSVHIVGTAYAEAVAGESNQYDLYIELEHDELDKVPGEYGWDIEAVYNDNDVSTLVRGTMTLKQSMGDHEDREA